MNRVNDIERQIFFQSYRAYFGRIRYNNTVDTINAILNRAELEETIVPELAYMLATSYHEARHRKYKHDFFPIVERGSWNYIVKQYWYNNRVRKWLGNDTIDEAWKYRGRGLVQLTGEVNYERFGIENHPEYALNPVMAVKILFEGMRKGIFTGRGLRHYFSDKKKDYVNARRIINGTDKAELIASYAEKFECVINESNFL